MAQDSGPETRAEKQSLALEAVGRILEHHAPAAAAAPSKHPDYWPGISFFAKRREQAWRERKAEEKQNAMKQELREQAPAGPNGQKLSPAQAAIAAKFDALNGGSSKNYDEMRKEYERETGHKLRPSAPAHRGAREWGSTWRLPDARAGSEGREHGSRRQSLEGRGTHEPMTGDEEGPGIETEERYQRPYGNENQVHEEGKEVKLEREIADLKHQLEVRNEAINAPVHEDKTAALEREVHELRKELGGVEEDVRHGWEGGMHIEGGSTRSGGIWDGASRRAVVPTARGGSGLQEVGGEGGEAEEEGGGVATGAPGEKDYDKYGVELDKYKDPVPLHYRDDVAGGVEVHTREDEIRKIHEYQAKIAEEQGKMRDDWKKLMEKPAPVTDATRPDIMDPDSFPTEGAAFRKKYQEMKDFKAAVEAFNHDPEFNPMIVLKAHHLVKYGIPAPESDSIDVWRQWYRETLDKYKVVRHQVTDMASGNWHDYETDWDIHGIHRPGAYKKVWRTRDDWGPGKPHAPLVESPNANFTLVAGGGVAEEGVGGELQNETAAEVAEAEAEAPAGGAAAEAPAEAPSGEASAEAAGAASEAAAVGEGGANEKAPVAALANKVDNLEHKLDQVVNLLEASRGSAVPAATLRSRTQQRLAQQHHNLRKEYLPSAAERDRMARAADARRAGASAAAAGHVSTLVAARKASATQGELKATATAAAMEALGSHAQGASSAEEKILKHPPKAVLSWLVCVGCRPFTPLQTYSFFLLVQLALHHFARGKTSSARTRRVDRFPLLIPIPTPILRRPRRWRPLTRKTAPQLRPLLCPTVRRRASSTSTRRRQHPSLLDKARLPLPSSFK
jgi:hypothetical protein